MSKNARNDSRLAWPGLTRNAIGAAPVLAQLAAHVMRGRAVQSVGGNPVEHGHVLTVYGQSTTVPDKKTARPEE
jgi:hypothetical protein